MRATFDLVDPPGEKKNQHPYLRDSFAAADWNGDGTLETGLFVGDFNGDGKPDLACLGYTNTGVGAGGPLAVYIYQHR